MYSLTLSKGFVVGLAILDIVWSRRYPDHIVADPDDEDDKYIDESQTISYLHACLS